MRTIAQDLQATIAGCPRPQLGEDSVLFWRDVPDNAVIVLTGDRQAGKTTVCQRLARAAAAQSFDIAGVLSPALFANGAKTGIMVTDLRSGRRQHLATRRLVPHPGDLNYLFDQAALDWANGIVASATPCDLLLIDEVGPLEIERDCGITTAFDVLRDGHYRLAVVVVRPSLVDTFVHKLGMPCEVVAIEQFDVDALLSRLAGLPQAVKHADD